MFSWSCMMSLVLLLAGGWLSPVVATQATSTLTGYPDLPNPTANLQTVPAGSLVIPMDLHQYTGGVFNVRAYGLAFFLLHAEVPIYWVITTGKAKDAVDFTTTAHQYWVNNGSSSASASVSFSGGPFVIHKSYVSSALNVTSANGFTDVVTYILDQNTTVDVRHTLLAKPKVLLSNLSGYVSTVVNPLVAAGLINGTHYSVASAEAASSVISSLNSSTCYTTFAEPHYVFSSSAPVYFSAVQQFVLSGGNFYAQCASTRSYENAGSGFMVNYGIEDDSTTNTDLQYMQPDLPFSQFLGEIDGTNSGVVTDFYVLLPSNLTYGSSASVAAQSSIWRTNAYAHVLNNPSAVTYDGLNLTISSAVKLTTDLSGGMIFYMGGHEWTSSSATLANGRRMYFNALLTPATRPSSCGFDFCPTGETCTAGSCQICVCVNNAKYITNSTCCTDGVATDCPSPSPSVSATPSPSPSTSATPSPSPTRTPSTTPSPSSTTSPTTSPSSSPSTTPSPSSTTSPTTSPSSSPSTTPSPSSTTSPSSSPSASASPSLSPSPSAAVANSGLSAGATAGVAVGAVAGGVAAVGGTAALVGAGYMIYRHMNRMAPTDALPTGSAMFAEQSSAQTNDLFTAANTEFHNEMYSI